MYNGRIRARRYKLTARFAAERKGRYVYKRRSRSVRTRIIIDDYNVITCASSSNERAPKQKYPNRIQRGNNNFVYMRTSVVGVKSGVLHVYCRKTVRGSNFHTFSRIQVFSRRNWIAFCPVFDIKRLVEQSSFLFVHCFTTSTYYYTNVHI